LRHTSLDAGSGVKRDVATLADREHDLLVVGGGIYGAAACWDAAQRGLKVALVEKADFGSGTSWNSLKTIHGGLRHLQRLQIGLLRESMRERRALLRIAPALVRPLPFLVPTYGHGRRGREAMALGLWLNDTLSRDRNDGLAEPDRIPPSRVLSRAEVLELLPGVKGEGLSGGVLWSDAQAVNSERLLLAFLQAAAAAGAVVANAVEVLELTRHGSRVTGARVRDHEGGGEAVLRARMVLNAAGPGVSGLLRRAGIERPRIPLLRATNFVLRRAVVERLAVGSTSGGRHLFLVPWRGRSIVGTDYEPADAPGDPRRQRLFLDDARAAFPWARLEPEDVALVHSGLVPGKGGADGLWTSSLVVDHESADGVAGLATVLGAKYTTARSAAEKAVDIVLRRLGRAEVPCRTAVTPLAAARLPEGPLDQQVQSAVRDEMALALADVVFRRTELGSAGPASEDAIRSAAAIMARERGWGSERLAAEHEQLELAWRLHEPRLSAIQSMVSVSASRAEEP
jgi:glycerol-3-phosphate dehydrogenase